MCKTSEQIIWQLSSSAVQQVCVPFKILMWTLLACERIVNVMNQLLHLFVLELLLNTFLYQFVITLKVFLKSYILQQFKNQ